MSKLLTGLVSAAVLSLSCSAFANSNTTSTTHTTIETACATEATTANCGSEKGHALAKCIHEYKKANKSFTVSEDCKHAMKQAHGK